jgi:ribonuclease-3 family protein
MNWQIIPQKTLTLLQLQQLSPASWAYIGDAVYELYVRQAYLLPPKRLQLYHQSVVAQVRAETQANQLKVLEPLLTHDEIEVLRRGRNATHRFPKRLDRQIYQQATSLETLVGYLYLTNPERLSELMAYLDFGRDDET